MISTIPNFICLGETVVITWSGATVLFDVTVTKMNIFLRTCSKHKFRILHNV